MADFSLKRISRQMSQLLGRTAPFLELGIDVEELENSQKKEREATKRAFKPLQSLRAWVHVTMAFQHRQNSNFAIYSRIRSFSYNIQIFK
jgi:hypothetical protein